jgi:hypothetical protein
MVAVTLHPPEAPRPDEQKPHSEVECPALASLHYCSRNCTVFMDAIVFPKPERSIHSAPMKRCIIPHNSISALFRAPDHRAGAPVDASLLILSARLYYRKETHTIDCQSRSAIESPSNIR